MLKCTMRRRSWARISSTNSTLWVTVGTTKKSRAIKVLAHGCSERSSTSARVTSLAAPDTSRPSIWPPRCPAYAARRRSEVTPQVGFVCHMSGSGRVPPWQRWDDRASPADSSVANGHESAAVARRSRCGAGRMPEPRASLARSETARPRTDDQWDGAADERWSVGRRQADAVAPGVPGIVRPETGKRRQRRPAGRRDRKHDSNLLTIGCGRNDSV